MNTQRSKQSTRAYPIAERPYKLFAVNFHGKPLKPLRHEFTRQVKIGLRRKVFVVDIDEEIALHQEAARRIAMEAGFKKRAEQPLDVLPIILGAIQRCQFEYDNVQRIIDKENSFDLTAYLLKNLTPRKQSLKPPPGRGTKQGLAESCPKVEVQEHNIVGKPQLLSKRKYILDEPESSKTYIVLIGNMRNQFYLDLLQHHEPLQAIVHFLPGECGYDILLPHPENKEFVLRTLEEIQADTYQLRQKISTKPVGIFQQELPVISRCLAEKLSLVIFDQLSWSIYDVETTYRRYLVAYVKPYNELNVKMSPNASVEQMQQMAESLSLQGHFLLRPVPAVDSEIITIVMYLESLINTMGKADEVLTESEMLLLSMPTLQSGLFSRLNELVKNFRNAFASIMKIISFERIVIEQQNHLLLSLVSHLDDTKFRNIFLTCLEYNLLSKYCTASYMPNNIPYRAYDNDSEPFYLPGYVKFYATESAVLQHLAHWHVRFDQCDVNEIIPGCKLYHFKNIYNEIIEDQEMMIIPTRLCFRDFTLFLMEDFKDEFNALEMLTAPNENDTPTEERRLRESLQMKPVDFNDPIFIRPNSLQARSLRNAMEQDRATEIGRTPSVKTSRARTSPQKHTLSINNAARNPKLNGYNLDDTRQEITVKTSKYHFDEGKLLLYEERWCFADMNKALHVRINRCKLHLARPRNRDKGISPNIRLTVNKSISIRVLNKAKECAKAVINYPNGLSVYHHETYAEQVWYPQETFNHERRRVYTPYGAVIVHYKDDDLIMIMRYNGEVYKLYQYEFAAEEEEAMEEEEEHVKTPPRVSATKQQISVRKSKGEKAEKETNRKSNRNEPKDKTKLGMSAASKAKLKHDISSSSQVLSSSSFEPKPKPMKQLLIESIDNELQYLAFLCTMYNLQYLHLIVTASTGNIINITHKGRVYKGRNKPTIEWQDYFANECYAMRGDGVRMIWTKDALKCYHKDGTLITTQTVEGSQHFDAEFDISQSSSHEDYEMEERKAKAAKQRNSKSTRKGSVNTKVDAAATNRESEQTSEKLPRNSTTFTAFHFTEGEEEGLSEYTSYITYSCDSFLMQHICYAEVYVTLTDALFNAINVEITTIQDIRIQIFKELPFEDFLMNDGDFFSSDHTALEARSYQNRSDRTAEPDTDKVRSARSEKTTKSTGGNTSGQPSSGRQPKLYPERLGPFAEDIKDLAKYTVKICVGDNMTLQVTDEDCLIDAPLLRHDPELGVVREPASFRIRFDANIVEVFRELVEAISEFKGDLTPKSKELYFLERVKGNCERQGFRFFDALPVPSKYNFTASNVFTELYEVKTIKEQMMNNYPWFSTDAKKFPRFTLRHKSSKDPKMEFPLVLSATTYIQIPRLLTSSDEIKKFLVPFDDITYEKTRHHIKDALEYYMRPFIRIELAKLWSKNNWAQQHIMHNRRLFLMQQRKGLYHAMLKHKVYPKYHQFVNTFDSHVKNIDFFDFVSSKCAVKKSPADELRDSLAFAKASMISLGGSHLSVISISSKRQRSKQY